MNARQQENGGDENSDWRACMESLCASYWYPAYAYLRRKGYEPSDCQDLTQDFFASLIEKNVLQIVDPERGRFRWFLMHALRQFAANWNSAQKAKKRGGDLKVFSLSFEEGESRYQNEPVDGWTPERLFDRRWALTLLHTAIKNLELEYSENGKTRLFESLKIYISPGVVPPSYAEVADTLGLTETAIKVAIHRLREKYRNQIRALVAETLDDPADLDEELQQLMESL